MPWVREADVLLVDGGDATYLCHWMRESGLADLLPSLPDTVWVGVSAGSMVMTPRIGDDFVDWPSAPDDRTLGVVDFSIFPHLDHELMPENTLAEAERWAAEIGGPAYAIDDQTAITVVDGRSRSSPKGSGSGGARQKPTSSRARQRRGGMRAPPSGSRTGPSWLLGASRKPVVAHPHGEPYLVSRSRNGTASNASGPSTRRRPRCHARGAREPRPG